MSLLGTMAHAIAPELMRARWLARKRSLEDELTILPALTSHRMLSLDIGANRGLYVEFLIPISRRVVAFEPLRDMQEVLKKFYPDLQVEKVALANKEGSAEIRLPRGNSGLATLSSTNRLERSTKEIVSQMVPTRTLDGYSFRDVGLIKIDVEGFEDSVLEGAEETIRRERPNLLIEIEERHRAGAVHNTNSWASLRGYSGYFVDGPRLRSIDEFRLDSDQPISNVFETGRRGRYINNFIFVARDRSAELERFCNNLLALSRLPAR